MGRIPQLELTGEMSQTMQNYALAYIRPYHKEIARRAVLGETEIEIARAMDISQPRLSIIFNSPLFKVEIARLEAMRDAGVMDVTTQIQELAPVALETLERVMIYGKSESLRVGIAQDLLDRAGHGAVKKFDGTIITETHEQRIARLMGDDAPRIINVTSTGVQLLNNSDKEESGLDQEEDLKEGKGI